MTTPPGYPSVPTSGHFATSLSDAASNNWVRRIVDGVNSVLRGKLNAVLPVTLTANATTTTVIDARIGFYSAFLFEPTTAHAAALLYETPYILVTNKKSGQATLNHASNANTDLSFNLLLIG